MDKDNSEQDERDEPQPGMWRIDLPYLTALLDLEQTEEALPWKDNIG